MNVRHLFNLCIALAVFGAGFGLNQAMAQPQGRSDFEEGVQVLTRGPVHEAFAETVTFDPQPGIVVTRAPPEPIEESPPEQRPEGANVSWIPGYWAWDDEGSDFLWVSGIWRALPPGRQWVSGYWGKSSQGFQWTSGYWANAASSEIEYLPEPPATVEVGSNIAAPSADHTWLPGCWMWHQSRYAWRPGFWATVQSDWDWVPAHYVWAPRGYIFVDGYWDHTIGRRGVLFAPVRFDAGVYTRRGFHYSPATAIDLSVFTNHLFWRPHYHHYYFGDYYASSYQSAGFYPSYSVHSSRHGYDPIYAHHRWRHRGDREWERRMETDFRHRRDHEDARPPRTLAAQTRLIASAPTSREKGLMIATSLDQLVRRTDSPVRFQALDKQERQQIVQRRQEIQQFRTERQRLETQAAESSVEKPSTKSRTGKVRLPTSPIVARPGDAFGKDQAPPKTHVAPQLDPKIEPQPKKAFGKREPPTGEPRVKKFAPPLEQPKGEPRVKKSEPQAPQPKAPPKVNAFEPQAPQPKGEPRVKKSEPQPPQPKAEPRVKAFEPQAPQPKGEPRVKKSEPQPSQPKAPPPRVKTFVPQSPQPKGEPRVQPPQPKGAPRVKKSEPQPPQPKGDPKETPKGKFKEKG